MARYIDGDKLCEYYQERHKNLCLKNGETDAYCQGYEDAMYVAEHIDFTADVVPKSEVDNLIDDLKRYVILNENISKKCKVENGEQNAEYWKGKLSAFLQVRGYIDAELKKKCEESENG